MVRIVIKKLVWDAINRKHIDKHNVSQQEVEVDIRNLIAYKNAKKGRFLSIGRSGTKLISIVMSRKGPSTYYVVTARDADRKERRIVNEKEKKE